MLDVIPASNFSCDNGRCVAFNLCQCFDGWTGDQCDQGKKMMQSFDYFQQNIKTLKKTLAETSYLVLDTNQKGPLFITLLLVYPP